MTFLISIIIFLAIVGVSCLLFGSHGILVGVILGGIVFWLLNAIDVFGKLDTKLSIESSLRRDARSRKREDAKHKAKMEAERKKAIARDAITTRKAVLSVSASDGASAVLKACLADFPYPDPGFEFGNAKPDKPNIPTVTISSSRRLQFHIESTGLSTVEELSFFKYNFNFNAHGFANQPDGAKQSQLVLAFADSVAREYERRYPQIKGETYNGGVVLTKTKVVANPNYNKQSW